MMWFCGTQLSEAKPCSITAMIWARHYSTALIHSNGSNGRLDESKSHPDQSGSTESSINLFRSRSIQGLKITLFCVEKMLRLLPFVLVLGTWLDNTITRYCLSIYHFFMFSWYDNLRTTVLAKFLAILLNPNHTRISLAPGKALSICSEAGYDNKIVLRLENAKVP